MARTVADRPQDSWRGWCDDAGYNVPGVRPSISSWPQKRRERGQIRCSGKRRMTGVVEIDEFGFTTSRDQKPRRSCSLDGQHCCQELGIHGWHFEHRFLPA